MRFTDRVAIITAGGERIAAPPPTSWRAKGAVVVAVGIDEGWLDNTVARAALRRWPRACKTRRRARPRQGRAVAASVAQEFGAIDILVNAVGGSTIIPHPSAEMDQLTFPEWQRLIAFNLDGTFLFCHAVAPIMKRQRLGKIVNLSSIAGRGLSGSSSAAYAAAKGGIIAFTRKIALTRSLRHQCQRDRTQPHLDRMHPSSLGTTKPGGPGGRNRANAVAAYCRGCRSGKGDLFSRVERR